MSDFTPEQSKIINKEYGNLVVSASAGSGKTRVMTERFINLVLKNKASVTEILCVTFTRLASEQLKARIGKALRAAMLNEKDEFEASRLQRELEDLPLASVSTVHSFCNALIKKYFYAVDVDPQFTVIDETTSLKMKKTAIDELFEQLYDEDDGNLTAALNALVTGRSDKNLRATILKLSDFISSEVDGHKYIDECVEAYSEEGVKNAVNGLIALFIGKFSAFLPAIDALKEKSAELGVNQYVKFLMQLVGEFDNFSSYPTLENFKVFASAKRDKPRLVSKGDEDLEKLSDELGKLLAKIRAAIIKYYDVLSRSDNEKHSLEAGKLLYSLAAITKRYDEKYARLKGEISALDYSDLEHYAYKLLDNDEIIADVKGQFKYIFVDEYQDTNAIQEALFTKLSEDNLFIVGDEKQSIYGFRGCDSSIFERHIINATKEQLYSLDVNFRSAKNIVNAVNNVFGDIMTEQTVGRSYSNHPMIYGGLYGNSDGIAAVVYSSKPEKQRSESKLPEGVYSIKKHLDMLKNAPVGAEVRTVRELVDKVYGLKYTVSGGDGLMTEKTVGFGDIAVLTHTGKGFADSVVNELISSGIPVASVSKRSIGEYPEIKLVLALLEAIDKSGKEDYSLATALRSPVGGLDDEQLLSIRNEFKDDSYYSAVNRYRFERIDDISIKLNEFFDYIGQLKLLSNFEGVAEILKRIIADKQLDLHFYASTFGDVKIKRLERFISACENGGNGYTLSEFSESKDAILENMTLSFADGENAVKVMNIHQSKGLEFPVVILCQTGWNFFGTERRSKFSLSKKFGIGIKHYDADKKKVYHTIVKDYIDFKNENSLLTEEMRLFYVAMTRAEYCLYIVTGKEPVSKRMGFEAENATCFVDFLSKTDCEYLAAGDELISGVIKEDRKVIFSETDEEGLKRIRKFLDFKYAYSDDVKLSVKRTVTEIASSTADEDLPYVKPISFGESAERGTAYHKFLQLCSMKKESASKELDKLICDGVFTKEEAALVSTAQLEKILACPIFDRLSGYKLYREQQFLASIPAEVVGEKGRGDVLVQGVIDLLAVREGKAVIVDYKYSNKDGSRLINTYEKQLDLYAYAVEKVLKINVEEKYLFNIKTCELVKLPH